MKDKNATVIVDLTPSEEDILKNLDKDARWGINRALREGLKVEECKNFEEFYQIYRDEMLAYDIKPESLENIKKDTFICFACKKEGSIIGVAGIEMRDNKPVLKFNASIPEFRKFQTNNLLYWECIKWAKNSGYSEFDLGGWQINARGNLEGINKFKERWGKIVYYEKDYPLYKAVGRKLIRKSKFFWWLNKKIKGLR